MAGFEVATNGRFWVATEGHSFALVSHLDLHFISIVADLNRRDMTPRVAMNVREAFLDNPEDGGFQFLRESLEVT